MKDILVYSSPSCGRCNVLKHKLKERNIDFKETNDIDVLIELGYTQLPVVNIDGSFFEFKEALEIIDEL